MSLLRTRRRGRLAAILVVTLLGAGLVWGLGAALASGGSPSPTAGKTILRLGWTSDADNLNPFIGYETSSYEVWALNYELLVGFRSSDYANVPGVGLATAWSHSPDGKVWTFTITDKSRWQDGVPLTAHDVAFTYNYIIKNNMGMFTDYMKYITKVEAPDDTHVVFTCSKPKANMLGLWVPILPEHIWSKISPSAAQNTYKNSPPIIGSGPFQTVEWQKGQYLRMVANKAYWRGAPKIDEIIFQMYQNTDTMAQDLKSGAIQSAENFPAPQFNSLNRAPLTAIKGVTVGFDELGFNCADKRLYPKSTGNPVLLDPKFRQALQWAIDKNKIATIAYNGDAAPADTIITRNFYPTSADYHWTPPADQAYTFDLQKAGDMLTAAGYPLVNGVRLNKQGKPIVLRLYARTESTTSQSCGALITGWFQQLGLHIKYSVIDEGALGDKQYNTVGGQYAPDFDMFIWGWGGDVDPNFILSILTTGSIQNWSDCAWSDPEYDALFLQQGTTIDVQKRIALVRQMQQIVYEQSPYIPLVYPLTDESANTRDWTGWVRSVGNKGLWWYNTQPDTYTAVHPIEASTAASGGSSAGIIAAVVIAAIVVIAVVMVVTRRRRGHVEAEE